MIQHLSWTSTVCLAIVVAGPAYADDQAVADSIWEGSIKVSGRVNGKLELKTHDCRLVILERDGTKFTGEFWWSNDARGIGIEGTIDKGGMRFTASKELRGDSLNDLINNVRVSGRFRGKEMKELQLKFAVPGTQPRSGEIKVKLQE
jgi:hypothetical protein